MYSENRPGRETTASFYRCVETINQRRKHEFIISLGFPTHSAAVCRGFFPAAHRRSRRNTKTTIYDCRHSRSELILPDFTSAPSNPTDRSLRLFYFFPSSSSSSSPLPPPLPPLVLTSGWDRKKSCATSRTALRVHRKKGRFGSSITTVRMVVASCAKEGDDRRKGRRKERKKGTRGNRRMSRERERERERTQSRRERHGWGTFLLVGPH